MALDILSNDGEMVISAFNGRIAKFFKASNQVLLTYNHRKQSDSDIEKLEALLSGEQEFDLNNQSITLSCGWAADESGGGVLYTVNACESLTELDCYGTPLSDERILLFNVEAIKSWTV